MFINKIWFYIVTFYLNIYFLVECGIITPREMDIRRANQMDMKKRPFCNAFTGCGKKRAPAMPYHMHESGMGITSNSNGQDEEVENSLGDLMDLNAEPAVEDLMRQIMSQAKLWEAIQEASREISMQKNSHDIPHYPMSFNTQ